MVAGVVNQNDVLFDAYREDPRFIELMQYLEEQEAEGRSKDVATEP